MNDIMNKNVPVLSIGEMVKEISSAYIAVLKSGLPVKTVPSVMLWGPPGVGKSQAVRQIGNRIEKETKKRVSITDVRLLLFNPIDLRGIPTANADKTLALSDLGTTQDLQNQIDITVTIPADVFPVGAEIDFVKRGDGNVTFEGAEGVTIQSADASVDLKMLYGGVYAKQMNSNIWLLRGDLE